MDRGGEGGRHTIRYFIGDRYSRKGWDGALFSGTKNHKTMLTLLSK